MAEYCGLDLGPTFGRHPHEIIELPRKKSPEECLKEFKILMTTRQDIQNEDVPDTVINQFLIARKHRVDESFSLFVNYHLFRQRHSELFERFNALDVLVQQALRDGFPGVLENRDRSQYDLFMKIFAGKEYSTLRLIHKINLPHKLSIIEDGKGRTVLVFVASRWNHNCYGLVNIYRSLLLSLEYLILDLLNQIRGFVVIVDWTEFTLKNSVSLNPRILKMMIEGLQDCFPARIKGVHFIGQPWYVEAVLALIKPFLKDRSKEKIHLHGNNLSTLHEHVAPDILPPEFGGEGPPLNPMVWTQKLIDAAVEEATLQPMYANMVNNG